MPEFAKHIGLFFGSFNPVHVGHLALANFIAENSTLDEIWFVVSPQNPFKDAKGLLNASHRVKMLELAIKRYHRFKVCDIELKLPTPSYSYKTLQQLGKLHPNKYFTIIMGSDNLATLNRWVNIEEILSKHKVMVYPRPEYEINPNHLTQQIEKIEAPVFNIDSTTIRKGLKVGKNYSFLIPEQTYSYILKEELYTK